ncbi:spermatogenesis-associated protein 20 [Sinocyclocheilus anshuiensis]|uniref:spermatogenesis-associated protein 20 n=1 Tax=Sinocyclocheilus anshuiensis TaxID=1608454 RepID=UPI0007B7B14D|nr:PREDICTED: spermatogenesis-associated protein 20 [Sinocyclocheilus anshuiensis]
MASGSDGPDTLKTPKHTNRLSKEKSSYVLQHAHNPVDWYPWGQEAFDKVKSEDKSIFLSVGYSTCHWCHVMERESFEDEEIGKILSENFVCIKVDREERPDVDKVYMTFLQWRSNGETLESSGERVLEALRKGTEIFASPGETLPSGPDVANRCYQQLAHSYEEEYGGFREAPKFPSPVNLMFLMSFWAVNRASSEGAEALQMALHTLRMMALGGIHDHVAQGFHRYPTDSSWHVPQFENMLYDQGQLAVAYITAYQVSGERLFAAVARDVLLYVSRDLSDKSGGFYSAEDADSFPTVTRGSLCAEVILADSIALRMQIPFLRWNPPRRERERFCVWTAGEIRALLPDIVEGAVGGATQADIFMHHYGVKEQGNVDPARVSGERLFAAVARDVLLYVSRDLSDKDPHGELQGQNVLIVHYSVELTAAHFGISVDRLSELLSDARAKLAEKILTFATNVLSSASPFAGFLDDYAFVVCGLLDLFEATQRVRWLQWAEGLQLRQDQLFWDSQGSSYFCSGPSDPTLLLALKQDQDGAEPSENSVSAMNLL